MIEIALAFIAFYMIWVRVINFTFQYIHPVIMDRLGYAWHYQVNQSFAASMLPGFTTMFFFGIIVMHCLTEVGEHLAKDVE